MSLDLRIRNRRSRYSRSNIGLDDEILVGKNEGTLKPYIPQDLRRLIEIFNMMLQRQRDVERSGKHDHIREAVIREIGLGSNPDAEFCALSLWRIGGERG